MKLNVPERDGPVFRFDGAPVYPGDYRIPEDLSQEVAQQIVEQGGGTLVEEEVSKKAAAKAKANDDILA